MKYVVTRTKDGTGWQTTGLEEFQSRPYLQKHGAKKMYIVATVDTWEKARDLMQKLRAEDYQRYLRRKQVRNVVLAALLVLGLWSIWTLVY